MLGQTRSQVPQPVQRFGSTTAAPPAHRKGIERAGAHAGPRPRQPMVHTFMRRSQGGGAAIIKSVINEFGVGLLDPK